MVGGSSPMAGEEWRGGGGGLMPPMGEPSIILVASQLELRFGSCTSTSTSHSKSRYKHKRQKADERVRFCFCPNCTSVKLYLTYVPYS